MPKRLFSFHFITIATIALLNQSQDSWARIAFTDRIQMETTHFGQDLIDKLHTAEKRTDTTTERVELKSIMTEKALSEMFQGQVQIVNRPFDPDLQKTLWEKDHTIQFHRRDQGTDGYLNGVFTIYGRSATFENNGVKLNTNLRLRARIYLLVDPVTHEVRRSDITKEFIFLEIKIKHPTTDVIGGSFKYRILLSDADVLRLLSANASNRVEFTNLLSDLKARAKSYLDKKNKPLNSPKLVDTIFDTIDRITQQKDGAEFIQPTFITNYIRESYAFTESQYDTRVYPAVDKKKFSFKTFRDSLIPSCFREPAAPVQKTMKEVQYQLTIDRHIRAIPQMNENPDLPNPPRWAKRINILNNLQQLDIAPYFYSGSKSSEKYEVRYPKGTVAVELKVPARLNILPPDRKSDIHQILDREIHERMKKQMIQRADGDLDTIDFEFGRGKAGHLSRMLDQVILKGQPKWALQTLQDVLAQEDLSGDNLEPIERIPDFVIDED